MSEEPPSSKKRRNQSIQSNVSVESSITTGSEGSTNSDGRDQKKETGKRMPGELRKKRLACERKAESRWEEHVVARDKAKAAIGSNASSSNAGSTINFESFNPDLLQSTIVESISTSVSSERKSPKSIKRQMEEVEAEVRELEKVLEYCESDLHEKRRNQNEETNQREKKKLIHQTHRSKDSVISAFVMFENATLRKEVLGFHGSARVISTMKSLNLTEDESVLALVQYSNQRTAPYGYQAGDQVQKPVGDQIRQTLIVSPYQQVADGQYQQSGGQNQQIVHAPQVESIGAVQIPNEQYSFQHIDNQPSADQSWLSNTNVQYPSAPVNVMHGGFQGQLSPYGPQFMVLPVASDLQNDRPLETPSIPSDWQEPPAASNQPDMVNLEPLEASVNPTFPLFHDDSPTWTNI